MTLTNLACQGRGRCIAAQAYLRRIRQFQIEGTGEGEGKEPSPGRVTGKIGHVAPVWGMNCSTLSTAAEHYITVPFHDPRSSVEK